MDDSSIQDVWSEIEALRKNIEGLRGQVQAERSSRRARATTFGAILGSVGALVAICVGVSTLGSAWFARTDTNIVRGNVLVLGYEPDRQTITFEFDLAMKNSGGKADLITRANAKLETPSMANLRPTLSDVASFTCSSHTVPEIFPFEVPRDGTKPISCSVTSRLGRLGIDTFGQPGLRRLDVLFESEDQRDLGFDFEFTLTRRVISELFRSGIPQTRSFHVARPS